MEGIGCGGSGVGKEGGLQYRYSLDGSAVVVTTVRVCHGVEGVVEMFLGLRKGEGLG